MHDNPLTKGLIGLCVVQTEILIFVGLRVMSIEQNYDSISRAAPAPPERSISAARIVSAPVLPVLEADDVRDIMREELAEMKSDLTRISNAKADGPRPRPNVDPEFAAEMKAAFDRDLNFYIGRGVINEAEMAALQQSLAKLPPTKRSAL